MTRLEPNDVVATLEAAYGAVTDLVTGLTSDDFDRPTRCEGLSLGPLLTHLLLDAQRALMAFATPASPPPDRDFVTYWRDFPPQDRPKVSEFDPSVRFVTRMASAYARPERGLVAHWHGTASAAVRAASAAPPDGYVETQGHVLAVPDFVATLAFEAAVHQLDLGVDLPDAAPPPDSAFDLVTATLDGLLGDPARDRTGWDATTYALKATGRIPLDGAETKLLGDDLAARVPVLG